MKQSFRALSHRYFLLIWLASLLSNIGNWMENVGQGWVVAQDTHSAFRVEFLSFAQFAAVLILAIPAGIIADTYDRKKVILFAQVMMCIFAAALAILGHLNMATADVITLITFLEGAAWAFNGPAWQAVIPHVVPRKDFESAVALNSIQYNLARLLGPAIAGFIVARWGVAYAFDINVLSFLAVILVLLFVKFDPKVTKPQNEKANIRSFGMAVIWVAEHPGARRLVVTIFCFALLTAPLQGLMPYIASDILMAGPRGLGFLLASLGAGAVFGGYLFGMLPTYYPKHHLIPLSMTALGLLMITYSQVTHIFIYILLFLIGIFWLWTMIGCNTAMQLLVPEKMRGRVMSIMIMAHVGVLPFGHLLGGVLAEKYGPSKTLLMLSIATTLFGIYTLWSRIPEIDGYHAGHHPTHFKGFFSEVILASSHRAEALALDRTQEKTK